MAADPPPATAASTDTQSRSLNVDGPSSSPGRSKLSDGTLDHLLRDLPVFNTVLRPLDVNNAPDAPAELFVQWLTDAMDNGEPEPHAMTLSTIGYDNVPDARVLILKDLDERGWWFATSAESTKGLQLSRSPAAALTFYWKTTARQVRVRGAVITDTAEANAADFLARGARARAVAAAGHAPGTAPTRDGINAAIAAAAERLTQQPDMAPPAWKRYAVTGHQVEFWQADAGRAHYRLRYTREPNGRWSHTPLWP